MGDILLEKTYFGNTLISWFVALVIFVAVWTGLTIFKATATRRLERVSRDGPHAHWFGFAADLLRSTRGFFFFVAALYVGRLALDLPSLHSGLISTVTVLGLLAQAALWANTGLTFYFARVVERRVETDASSVTTIRALSVFSRLALWTIFLLLALDNLGINITALVAGLGITGIAVALAVQNILADLFASLSIVLDKPFLIGDFVIVGDYMGTIEHIGLKTTRVRSLTGEQIIFSNEDLLQSRIRNYKRMMRRRIAFTFTVTYETPRDKLTAIPTMLREIIEGQAKATFDRAHFKSYGDIGLIFEVVYYVEDPDYNLYMDIQQAINLAVMQRFAENGIAFAYVGGLTAMLKAGLDALE